MVYYRVNLHTYTMADHINYQFLIIMVYIWIGEVVKCEHQEICDDTEFVAQCATGQALLAEKAKFGRMKIGKCVKNDLGYLGCQNDVLNLVDSWCSGLSHCSIMVSNDDLNAANTACLADLNSYLEIEYICVPVINPNVRCTTQVQIVASESYLSSHVTSQTGCGSLRSPWMIEAQPGQTVHLWLIDFGALDRQHQSLYTSCHRLYGFIVERDLGVNLTMCGGTERKTEVYKSKTNKVEVHLLADRQDKRWRFLIKHKFIGCADLIPPVHAWYKRQGNEAVIGCKFNDRVWHLKCKENSWSGVVGNCTKGGNSDQKKTIGLEFTLTSVVFLTCVVCGAILLIITVIVAGTVYVKKQRIKHNLKLRSDYGLSSQEVYYTLKTGYDTMSSALAQHPIDIQPLVHITDKEVSQAVSQSPRNKALVSQNTQSSDNLM